MSRQTRVAIIGGRYYPRLDAVRDYVRKLHTETLVISGGHWEGVDDAVENMARLAQLDILIRPARWKKHGKGAGPIRNRTIARDCDYMVAFWDGESRGTADAIQAARDLGREVLIFGPDGNPMH